MTTPTPGPRPGPGRPTAPTVRDKWQQRRSDRRAALHAATETLAGREADADTVLGMAEDFYAWLCDWADDGRGHL